jgi:Protein of unknown function (DUF3822)
VLHPSVFIESSEAKHVDTAGANLLVQTGSGFIGFASFQPTEKKVNSWILFELDQQLNTEQLEEKLSAIAAAYTWVHTNYQKVILLQYAPLNVLVPAILNSESGKEQLLQLVHGPQTNQVLVKDIVLQQSVVNHYAVDAGLASLLNKRFPKGEWWHVQSLLLTKTAAGEARVTATICFNEVQLTVERNGNWLLLQTYNYHTPEDVLYYILNCMQQLELTQEETTVYLQGMIDQQSALYDVLYLYILNLKLKDELQFSFPPATDEHPVHLSASLDQVLVCVS